MAFIRDSAPDLTGLTAAGTGANGGLGLETAAVLADKGAIVIMAARDHGRALDPDNPHLHGRYDPGRAYGQSKLANHPFGLGLQARAVRLPALLRRNAEAIETLWAVSERETGIALEVTR